MDSAIAIQDIPAVLNLLRKGSVLLVVLSLEALNVVVFHGHELLVSEGGLALGNSVVVGLEAEGVLLEEEAGFGEVGGDVLVDVEAAVAELVVQHHLSVQVVNAVLDQVGHAPLERLPPGLPVLVPPLQLDLREAGHEESDEGNGEALLLGLSGLPLAGDHGGVDEGLVVCGVGVVGVREQEAVVQAVDEEEAVQALDLVGSEVEHAVARGDFSHLLDVSGQVAVEGDPAGGELEGEAFALLGAEDVGDLQQRGLPQSPPYAF